MSTGVLSCLVDKFQGSYAGRPLIGVYIKWQAKRHDGFFLPELRLVMVVVPALLVPAGLLMFGFGVERYLHRAVLFRVLFLPELLQRHCLLDCNGGRHGQLCRSIRGSSLTH